MADNSYDFGLPSLAFAYPFAKRLAAGAAGYFSPRAIAGTLSSAPGIGAFLYGMGDGKGNATTAMGPEMDLYVRDPKTGQMVPNPALGGQNPMTNPNVNTLGGASSPSPQPPGAVAPPLPPAPNIAQRPVAGVGATPAPVAAPQQPLDLSPQAAWNNGPTNAPPAQPWNQFPQNRPFNPNGYGGQNMGLVPRVLADARWALGGFKGTPY